MIEIMVGVVIGMIAVLVIYQVFATSEGIKRNITAAGDAQQNGLLSSFMMGIELANAGNGLAVAAQDLGTCTPAGNATDSLRPIPLLITDGGGDGNPDSFVIYYSAGRTLVSAAPMQPPAGPGPYTDWYVQSANGFKAGGAQNKPDAMVLISQTGNCYSSLVDAVGPIDANGVVKISQSRVGALTYDSSWTLFNLGPANLVQKVRYDLGNGSLRSTSLLDPATGAPDNAQPVNPLVSNILNMKIQYGIDDVGDGLVHHWVPAIAGTPYGNWDVATLLTAPIATINRIKAARIAILVKSEQHDKDLAGQGFTRTVFNDCADGGTCYPVTFNVPAISAATQPWGWRYRVYETVIPLRNEVWNKEV